MELLENLKSKKFYYKMGVMGGELLYDVYEFDDFEEMMKEAFQICDKYHDMQRCAFVFQAFKDNSFDFKTSCFFQTKTSVYGIKIQMDDLIRDILHASEKVEG